MESKVYPFGFGILTIAKRNDPVLRPWNLDNVVSGTAADLVQVYSVTKALYAPSIGGIALCTTVTNLSRGETTKSLVSFALKGIISRMWHTDEGRQRHRRTRLWKDQWKDGKK